MIFIRKKKICKNYELKSNNIQSSSVKSSGPDFIEVDLLQEQHNKDTTERQTELRTDSFITLEIAEIIFLDDQIVYTKI